MSTALRRSSYLSDQLMSEHEAQRVRTLQELGQSLRRFPRDAEASAFSSLLHDAQLVLELSDVDLARMLGVSRPTIGRWARGDSAPHPLGRGPVFEVLAEIAEERLKRHLADQNRYVRRSAVAAQ